MMRKVLASKIHRATVTESNIDYEGSITIPPQLRQEADLMPYDAVQIWNVSSGTRFETYVIAGEFNDGTICINGAAAHLAKPGDLVIISRFVWLNEEEWKNFHPKVVMVDANNKFVAVKKQESTPHTVAISS